MRFAPTLLLFVTAAAGAAASATGAATRPCRLEREDLHRFVDRDRGFGPRSMRRLNGYASSVSPVLQTERLAMRQWRLDDAPAAFEMYGDPEVVRFLGGDLPTANVDAQRAWMAARAHRRLEPAYDVWAVSERATDGIVGTAMLKPIPCYEDRIEIGWHLARRVWGRGLAFEPACVRRARRGQSAQNSVARLIAMSVNVLPAAHAEETPWRSGVEQVSASF